MRGTWSKADAQRWAKALPEKEAKWIADRMVAVLEEIQRTRGSRPRLAPGLEPTDIYVPEDVQHIVCRRRPR